MRSSVYALVIAAAGCSSLIESDEVNFVEPREPEHAGSHLDASPDAMSRVRDAMTVRAPSDAQSDAAARFVGPRDAEVDVAVVAEAGPEAGVVPVPNIDSGPPDSGAASEPGPQAGMAPNIDPGLPDSGSAGADASVYPAVVPLDPTLTMTVLGAPQ